MPTASACSGSASVGQPAYRRLTRAQYQSAVSQIFGADSTATAAFVTDSQVGPFAANSLIPVTDLEVEKYADAAAIVAAQVRDKLTQMAGCTTAAGDDACADKFIAAYGRRTYRRPLVAAETAALKTLYTQGKGEGGVVHGLELVVQGLLASPSFLYVNEAGDASKAAGGVTPLTSFEIATRLALLTWNSTPDDALLDSAASGELASTDGIKRQAQRLMADARARQTWQSFHQQWLRLGDVATVAKDAKIFPAFTASVRAAMATESATFLDQVMGAGDAKLGTLLTASYSFPPAALYGLYGVSAPKDSSGRVDFDSSQRAGILGQAAFLSVFAHQDRSSPVHRGKVVRQNLLCTQLPDPPAGVKLSLPPPSTNTSTQQLLRTHKDNPSCVGCHNLMDPIGFGFEALDGIGVARTMDGGQPIDASGELTDTDVDGTFVGQPALAQKLAKSDRVSQCVVQQWFRYALGRDEEDADGCSHYQVAEAFRSSGGDERMLVQALVATDSFRFVRTP
jgi:hypothetical protein